MSGVIIPLAPTCYRVDEVDEDAFEKLETESIPKQGNQCDGCGIPLTIIGRHYTCTQCGLCEPYFAEEDTMFSNYNNDSGASSSLRIEGRDAGLHQKHHVKVTSDYSKKKEIDSAVEFDNLYFRSKEIEKPPKYVYERAVILFNKIQKFQTNRSTRRRGIQGACVYFEAKRAGMTKDRSLMATILRIQLKTLNEGINALEIFHAERLIDIPVFHSEENSNSFVYQNFDKYKIDKKYIGFVIDFIQRSEDKHIATSSGPNPKCIGTIYLLIKLLGLTQTLDKLTKECEISRPTYIRFYNEVINESNLPKFKKIFKKHNLNYKKALAL